MTNVNDRPMPTPTAWSKPYWDAASQGKLLIQHCNGCGAKIMNPKKYCPDCLSEDLGWSESNGTGRVFSYSIQKRAAASPFVGLTPYVVAVIKLDDGVQLLANIIGDGALDIQCEDRVTVDFISVEGSSIKLPVFRKAG